MDCLFCKINNNEIPSYTIYEDDYVKAFLDINPKSFGDTLVIPKKHFKDLDDIDIETITHLFEISKLIKKRIEERLKPKGVFLLQNNGDIQEIKHFHIHITPVYDNKDIKPIEEAYNILK